MTFFSIKINENYGQWLNKILVEMITSNKLKTLNDIKSDFELNFEDFKLFWFSKEIEQLKQNGLVSI